jgi:2,3-bisphosphoglycerate-dependent phosphoglycerate mutase
MTELILIRHGETDWNREGRWQGQADVPLNSAGLAQAARMASEVPLQYRLDAIYSSDLSRARLTAEALAAAAGLPVIIDPRWREIHQGEWQGMKVSQINERYGQEFQHRQSDPWAVAPPGGETAAQVRERVVAALSDVTARYPGGCVAVVSHGFVLAVARVLCCQLPLETVWELVPANCEPVKITCAGLSL